MRKKRNIELILAPPPFHWVGNGFKVHNFFPGGLRSDYRMSPFFLLDYNARMYYPPSLQKRGVGVHPHRGIETVTIAYHGAVAHHDSAGNGGIVYPGGVQWMTAGKAILHKEYHEQNFVEKGGDFQMVQLWVNLPAKHKMTEPNYQAINEADMNTYTFENNGSCVKVIAGEYQGVVGKAKTFTPIHLFNVSLEPDSNVDFEFNETHNTGILIIQGSIIVNQEKTISADNFILFKNDGRDIQIQSLETTILLIMSGEPIQEPLYPYGPFLMNTEEEIIQAFDDYKNGYFGFLED